MDEIKVAREGSYLHVRLAVPKVIWGETPDTGGRAMIVSYRENDIVQIPTRTTGQARSEGRLYFLVVRNPPILNVRIHVFTRAKI
jgi:hypothetical protein